MVRKYDVPFIRKYADCSERVNNMGEKIRDIRPIHLIGNELMVELNEGYTKNQGRVIHIQNKKFRYLLTESDYHKVSSDIMRAAVELDYIKQHIPEPDYKLTPKEKGTASDVTEFTFLKILNTEEIDYRILELRDHFATILINPSEYKQFRKLAKAKKVRCLEHPFGRRHGYIFLYQMKEFAIYQDGDYYYEVMCQLPCKSLTPKMWMPLDKCVQHALWETKRMENGYPYVEEEEVWIYYMTRCIFTKHAFEESDVKKLQALEAVLERDTLRQKLELIVFGFADRLIALSKDRKYADIMTEYFSYREY